MVPLQGKHLCCLRMKQDCLEFLKAKYKKNGRPLHGQRLDGSDAEMEVCKQLAIGTDSDQAQPSYKVSKEEFSCRFKHGIWEILRQTSSGSVESAELPPLDANGQGYWSIFEHREVQYVWSGGSSDTFKACSFFAPSFLPGIAMKPAAMPYMTDRPQGPAPLQPEVDTSEDDDSLHSGDDASEDPRCLGVVVEREKCLRYSLTFPPIARLNVLSNATHTKGLNNPL